MIELKEPAANEKARAPQIQSTMQNNHSAVD